MWKVLFDDKRWRSKEEKEIFATDMLTTRQIVGGFKMDKNTSYIDKNDVIHIIFKSKEKTVAYNKHSNYHCIRYGDEVTNPNELSGWIHYFLGIVDGDTYLQFKRTGEVECYKGKYYSLHYHAKRLENYHKHKGIRHMTYLKAYRNFMTDLIIICNDNKVVNAHKMVLLKHSKTLNDLYHDKLTATDNTINLDFDHKVVKKVINFLYDMKIRNIIDDENFVNIVGLFEYLGCERVMKIIVANHEFIPSRYKRRLVKKYDAFASIIV